MCFDCDESDRLVFYRTLLEQCKNNARNSAKIAAERIDGDILGQIKAGDEKTENYKEILSQLQDFLCGDDIKYIYTMRMNGDRLEFIVDADTEEGAAIGEEYEIYDEIAEAFDGNATVDSEMTSDEWGDFYSAFAPVYNSSGEIAGIVGVDCSATDIRLQENIFIKEFVIIELAGLVIAACKCDSGENECACKERGRSYTEDKCKIDR